MRPKICWSDLRGARVGVWGLGVEGTANRTYAGNAVFADFDHDAKLDLYIGNGQTSYNAPDELFFGQGDGTFYSGTAKLHGDIANPSDGSVACTLGSIAFRLATMSRVEAPPFFSTESTTPRAPSWRTMLVCGEKPSRT